MTKQKKSYGSHINANDEENAIKMCSKIRAPSHYEKMLFFLLPYQIFFDYSYELGYKAYAAETLHNIKGPRQQFNR